MFFSYAHVDWDAPANKDDVQGLVNGLEPQVHAELGHRNFEVWRDEDGIRWGNDWRDKLESTIDSSALMIVLLSPGWLKSDVCSWEYDTFKENRDTNAIEDRVLPISLRPLSDEDLKGLTEKQHNRYQELRKIQQQKWEDLAQLEQRDLNRLLDLTARALKKVMQAQADKPKPDRVPEVANDTARAADNKTSPPPVDGHIIPPVSGDYYIPKQARDTVQLKLAVPGSARVQTEEGAIVFAISGMTVQTTLTGGRIVNENPKFSNTWVGPVATVTRIQTGSRQSALQIDAQGPYMKGEPLTGGGDVGHVHLFDIEAEENSTIEVNGTVNIQQDAVRIEDDKCDLDPPQTEARATLIKRLSKILLRDHINPKTQLEGAKDDRSTDT